MKLVEKHAWATRWAHWVNFPVLFGMIWSGLLIYWANDVYRLGPVHLFPGWFYDLIGADHALATGMAAHFVLMWVFTLNGIGYVAYTVGSGAWRELAPDRRSFGEAWQVVLHDLGLRQELPPQGKYNAAQRITYSLIVVMGMGSVVTGLAIYKPVQVAWLTQLLGGYEMARFFHFWLTMGYMGFFLVHVGQVIKAGWNNFRAMVAGFEVAENG